MDWLRRLNEGEKLPPLSTFDGLLTKGTDGVDITSGCSATTGQ